MRIAVSTDTAPKAGGPYSQAVRAGQLLFVSGQVPVDPETRNLVDGGIEAQTHRVMCNIGEILKAANISYDNVVKTTVFLTDISDFSAMNAVYETYFKLPVPARATVQVAKLPKEGALVEIDAIALLTQD